MNIVERIRNILVQPKQEWNRINEETPDTKSIFLGYVLPLSLIPAVATVIGWGLIGRTYREWAGLVSSLRSWDYGLSQGVISIITSVLAVFLAAIVIDILATSFKSEKNFARSFQLVAYSWTPVWIGGILNIIPALSFLGTLLGIYALVLLYFGIGLIKKTPEESKVGYFVISLLVMIVANFIIMLIVESIISAVWVSRASMLEMGMHL